MVLGSSARRSFVYLLCRSLYVYPLNPAQPRSDLAQTTLRPRSTPLTPAHMAASRIRKVSSDFPRKTLFQLFSQNYHWILGSCWPKMLFFGCMMIFGCRWCFLAVDYQIMVLPVSPGTYYLCLLLLHLLLHTYVIFCRLPLCVFWVYCMFNIIWKYLQVRYCH